MKLINKDGTEQEAELIYGPYVLKETDWKKCPYPEYLLNTPIACVRMKGISIEKSWSVREVPIKFLLEK